MAIDPDVQPLLDQLNDRITVLESAPSAENDQELRDALSRFYQRFYTGIEGKNDAEIISMLDGTTF